MDSKPLSKSQKHRLRRKQRMPENGDNRAAGRKHKYSLPNLNRKVQFNLKEIPNMKTGPWTECAYCNTGVLNVPPIYSSSSCNNSPCPNCITACKSCFCNGCERCTDSDGKICKVCPNCKLWLKPDTIKDVRFLRCKIKLPCPFYVPRFKGQPSRKARLNYQQYYNQVAKCGVEFAMNYQPDHPPSSEATQQPLNESDEEVYRQTYQQPPLNESDEEVYVQTSQQPRNALEDQLLEERGTIYSRVIPIPGHPETEFLL